MMRMLQRCFTYGKKNCEGPAGWEDNDNLPWYDPKEKYSGEIQGGLAKGYTKEEIDSFFKTIENYCSYCFNRSHAVSYSVISIMTAWLKLHYPVEFWAAVLTITDDDKRGKYISLAKQEGIKIEVPDINVSEAGFTVSDKKILYGLGKVKSVGPVTLESLLTEREKSLFAGVEDINNRLPKKALRLNVFINLIMAGAFDFENPNRFELVNKILDIRKDKKTTRYDKCKWSELAMKEYEETILGTSVTLDDWWNTQKDGTSIKDTGKLISLTERLDKSNRLMAFGELNIKNSKVPFLMFASKYANNGGQDFKLNKQFVISGKKRDNKLFIDKVEPYQEQL